MHYVIALLDRVLERDLVAERNVSRSLSDHPFILNNANLSFLFEFSYASLDNKCTRGGEK